MSFCDVLSYVAALLLAGDTVMCCVLSIYERVYMNDYGNATHGYSKLLFSAQDLIALAL